MLIYTEKVTYRIRYIFQLILGQLLGIDIDITSDAEGFRAYEGPRISYGKSALGDELFFYAAGLLLQRGIEGQDLSFIEYQGNKAFFPSFSKASAMPFDPFSASFYMVSRYEEYLPYKMDEYGRFGVRDSIAFQKGFLHKPLVNIWAMEIGEILKKRYPTLELKKEKYRFIPTIDIDSAWQFRRKGFLRSVGGYFRSLFMGEFHDLQLRTRVLFRMERDPFDTYTEQLQILSEFQLRPVYFILFGEYGLNDKNIEVNNLPFQVLVKSIADYAEIGIHASFKSSYDSNILKTEISRLTEVIHRDIFRSRQHYLRLNLPYMYRALADLNIADDYSMGFNSHHGFRAGIASPFYFYDLDLDMPTRVRVFPFTFSINKFWKPDTEEKRKLIWDVIREVREVNGTLVAAWDNEALSSYRNPRWEEDFREILERCV